MPEITSVETIRAKLRDFEERIDGAIAAAKALGRVKADAEKRLQEIQTYSAAGEQSLQKADSIRLQLQQLQQEWTTLKQAVQKSQDETQEARELLLSEVSGAVQSLAGKVADAEERLKQANKASLEAQAQLLTTLEGSTRTNAEAAAKDKAAAVETARDLKQLLATIREELQGEARTRLLEAEELLDSQIKTFEEQTEQKLQDVSGSLTEKTSNLEKFLREQIASFKDEMKRGLSEHQQSFDRQLTEFLNKQNALVQNLNQQIDSYDRASQALAKDLKTTADNLGTLRTDFEGQKAKSDGDLASLASALAALTNAVSEIQLNLGSHSTSIAALQTSAEDLSSRLHTTIEKLGKRSWLTGIK